MQDLAREGDGAVQRNSVLILFGTVTGNAESLAQRTAEVIARRVSMCA